MNTGVAGGGTLWQVGTRQDRKYHATAADKRDVRKEAANNTPTTIYRPGATWATLCHKLGQQSTKLKPLQNYTEYMPSILGGPSNLEILCGCTARTGPKKRPGLEQLAMKT